MREKEEVKRKISGPHLCGDALDIKVFYLKKTTPLTAEVAIGEG